MYKVLKVISKLFFWIILAMVSLSVISGICQALIMV